MFWNQFDYYMNPNGTTYGARKGNEPVHIMYNMYRKCVNVVNNTFAEYQGAVARLEVYDILGNRISNTLEKTIDVGADGAPAAVDYAVSGKNRLSPRTIGLVKDENNSYDHTGSTISESLRKPMVLRKYGITMIYRLH